jgi:hypothetical protein
MEKELASFYYWKLKRLRKKTKSDFLELNVNRKNPAMYFYKKIGFELYEKADIAYGKFWLNDYVLRKSLVISH